MTCEGVCPAFEPGVIVDAGFAEKSVWLTDDRLGTLDGTKWTLCFVQVNNSPEDEILFRGDDGAAIVFDSCNELVYHEALASRSGTWSCSVLASNDSENETPLVADDEQIIACANAMRSKR